MANKNIKILAFIIGGVLIGLSTSFIYGKNNNLIKKASAPKKVQAPPILHFDEEHFDGDGTITNPLKLKSNLNNYMNAKSRIFMTAQSIASDEGEKIGIYYTEDTLSAQLGDKLKCANHILNVYSSEKLNIGDTIYQLEKVGQTNDVYATPKMPTGLRFNLSTNDLYFYNKNIIYGDSIFTMYSPNGKNTVKLISVNVVTDSIFFDVLPDENDLDKDYLQLKGEIIGNNPHPELFIIGNLSNICLDEVNVGDILKLKNKLVLSYGQNYYTCVDGIAPKNYSYQVKITKTLVSNGNVYHIPEGLPVHIEGDSLYVKDFCDFNHNFEYIPQIYHSNLYSSDDMFLYPISNGIQEPFVVTCEHQWNLSGTDYSAAKITNWYGLRDGHFQSLFIPIFYLNEKPFATKNPGDDVTFFRDLINTYIGKSEPKSPICPWVNFINDKGEIASKIMFSTERVPDDSIVNINSKWNRYISLDSTTLFNQHNCLSYGLQIIDSYSKLNLKSDLHPKIWAVEKNTINNLGWIHPKIYWGVSTAYEGQPIPTEMEVGDYILGHNSIFYRIVNKKIVETPSQLIVGENMIANTLPIIKLHNYSLGELDGIKVPFTIDLYKYGSFEVLAGNVANNTASLIIDNYGNLGIYNGKGTMVSFAGKNSMKSVCKICPYMSTDTLMSTSTKIYFFATADEVISKFPPENLYFYDNKGRHYMIDAEQKLHCTDEKVRYTLAYNHGNYLFVPNCNEIGDTTIYYMNSPAEIYSINKKYKINGSMGMMLYDTIMTYQAQAYQSQDLVGAFDYSESLSPIKNYTPDPVKERVEREKKERIALKVKRENQREMLIKKKRKKEKNKFYKVIQWLIN